MIDLGQHEILGVPLSAIDYDTAVARIVDAAKRGVPFSCSAIAVHAIMTAVHDPEQAYRLQHMNLLVPDGQPVRLGLRALHRVKLRDRVYGPELMLRVCERCEAERLGVFLFGSTQEVVGRLRQKLIERFPRLTISGHRPSRFRTLVREEADELTARIRESGARVTFVGLGCPRQEVWAYEFAPRLKMPVIAVGQGFELNAGTRPYPPRWMQRWSLEWLYRLAHEPRRLWRRYLLLGPEYLFRVARQRRGKSQGGSAVPPRSEILHG